MTAETHRLEGLTRRWGHRLRDVPLLGAHQVEGCCWMLEREETQPSTTVKAVRGGVLADEVGLGKTFMAAGLALANPVRLTLVVTLVNLKTQWHDAIKALARDRLKVCFVPYGYDGPPLHVQLLSETDRAPVCVLTTYNQTRQCPEWLTQTAWDRVILDEGHMVRNPKTSGFSALCEIASARKWVLTATPIHNGITDLLTLFQWIGVLPFDATASVVDRTEVQDPKRPRKNAIVPRRISSSSCSMDEDTDDNVGQSAVPGPDLASLTQTFVLRRTLATERHRTPVLRLLPCTEEEVGLDWDTEFERHLYAYVSGAEPPCAPPQDDPVNPTSDNAVSILRIDAFTRLRQICASFEIFERALSIKERVRRQPTRDADLSELPTGLVARGLAEQAKMERYLTGLPEDEEREDEEERLRLLSESMMCKTTMPSSKPSASSSSTIVAINLSSDPNDVDSKVHVPETIHPDALCVLDDADDTDKTTVIAPVVVSAAEMLTRLDRRFGRPSSSTKMRRLREMLHADFFGGGKDADHKIVIFTSFVEEMHLVEQVVWDLRLTCCRLCGSMTEKERENALRFFGDEAAGVRVLVAQIVCSCAGLNLQAADTVYITSPTWNPCTETQAIGRVHRQGQTRPVRVVRLYMKDTVEEACMRVQERKKRIIKSRLPSASTTTSSVV